MEERFLERLEGRVLFGRKGPSQSVRYFMASFTLPERTEGMRLSVRWTSRNDTQLPLILFSPSGDIRIIKASEGTVGEHEEVFLISERGSSPGTIPGICGEGEWKLLLYKRRFSEDLDVTMDIYVGPATDREPSSFRDTHFDKKVIDPREGWYEGELHTHSCESTGRTSVHEVVETARERGLDFLAITDHFAASHWVKLEEEGEKHDDILLLKSMEVSGDRGHACIHGLSEWLIPLVDENEELTEFLGLEERPTMSWIADKVHEAGGIMSVNHSLSGLVGWRYHDFDWRKADMFETWCLADEESSFQYPLKWDSLLLQGMHITGVGSSDSHDSRSEGNWKIGKIRNHVHASSLSREGIIEGLKKGRNWISIGESQLEISCEYEGKRYEMGDTIHWHGGDVTLRVKVTAPFNGNLFVIQSGDLNTVERQLAGDSGKELTFTFNEDIALSHRSEEYIRVEFHEETVKPLYFGMAFRDHRTMRLMSNPFWIRKEGEWTSWT